MEGKLLHSTDFKLQFPTLQQFTNQLLKDSEPSKVSKEYSRYVKLISNLTVFNFDLFNKFKKMHLAGVIIYFAGKLMNLDHFKSSAIMSQIGIS